MDIVDLQISFLLDTQNADGGWGARPGGGSQTEATALAVLALDHATDGRPPQALAAARAWLLRVQRSDGAWPRSEDVPEPSWMTSLAVLALPKDEVSLAAAVRGARWLMSFEGRTGSWLHRLLVRFGVREVERGYNPAVHGWPWVPATFGWVEPTAYALLALKRILPHLPSGAAMRRIDDAEFMLLDRMCAGGGWNYGNPRVLGEELPPYPDTTALALIGLQPDQATEATTASLDALAKMIEGNDSVLSLSLTLLCFRLFERPVGDLPEQLSKRWSASGSYRETRASAFSTLALTKPDALRMRRQHA